MVSWLRMSARANRELCSTHVEKRLVRELFGNTAADADELGEHPTLEVGVGQALATVSGHFAPRHVKPDDEPSARGPRRGHSEVPRADPAE